jgi:XTP/dITP diphosphohydrolase
VKNIIFVTGNQYKFKVAKKAAEKFGIHLIRKELETPEIQSTDLEKIAAFSAQWASDKLQKPVVLTDAGYYIEALKGFPGPFIKYANNWLTASDFLKLMKGKKNRAIITKDCLAYCEPGKKPETFLTSAKGKIAEKAGVKGTTSINEIFIPDGFDRVESEIPREEMVKFWNKNKDSWQKLANFLKSKK